MTDTSQNIKNNGPPVSLAQPDEEVSHLEQLLTQMYQNAF